MYVKLYKMFDDVETPSYASYGASCFDLRAYLTKEEREKPLILRPGETALIHTGIKMALPKGWELQIRPRSGMSLKTKMRVANAPGTVDSDYRGEICVIAENISPNFSVIYDDMYNFFHANYLKSGGDANALALQYFEFKSTEYKNKNSIKISHGDRICQAALSKSYQIGAQDVPALVEIDNIEREATERNAGGFGSTGLK